MAKMTTPFCKTQRGGWWVYAKKEDGDLVSSGICVGYGNPKKLGLPTNLKTDPER